MPGSVNAVAPSRKSSASPTGLLLSATVPGVLTGVVPAESLKDAGSVLRSIHIPGFGAGGPEGGGDQAAAIAQAQDQSLPNDVKAPNIVKQPLQQRSFAQRRRRNTPAILRSV